MFYDRTEMKTFLQEQIGYGYQEYRFLTDLSEMEMPKVTDVIVTKLYKSALEKYGKINFEDIPKSEGDITKLIEYSDMKQSIDLMKIVKEQSGINKFDELDTLEKSVNYIEKYKNEFTMCFKTNKDFGILMYNTLTMTLLQATSYLMSVSVEFVKRQNSDSYDIVMNDLKHNKQLDTIMLNSLAKFNKIVENGDLAKIMNYTLSKKEFAGETVAIVAIAIGLAMTIVPLIRDLIYHFYNVKAKLSAYCQIQSEYLQANINRINLSNEIDPKRKKEIIKKQENMIKNLESISSKLRIDSDVADKSAKSEISKINIKVDDIRHEMGVGSLNDMSSSNSIGLI